MQRWLSGQYRNFRQKLTGWRYKQQYKFSNRFILNSFLFLCVRPSKLSKRMTSFPFPIWNMFSPYRPHCWLRRRRRPGWRRTWSTLFRASATSKKFWRVPPAFEAWGTPWSLGQAKSLKFGRRRRDDVSPWRLFWKTFGQLPCLSLSTITMPSE